MRYLINNNDIMLCVQKIIYSKNIIDMDDILLATWQLTPDVDAKYPVIPDGCRDLIMQVSPKEEPYWFISSLQDKTKVVPIKAGGFSQGFRLKPGARIDENELLKVVQNQYFDIEDIYCHINNHCHLSPSVSEVLACLASEVLTVNGSAKLLGVNQRTLQRLLLSETNRSPAYWLMLSRVRKAARMVVKQVSLSEIAYTYGFSDQAHMTREFVRWFNITPSKIKYESVQFKQLQEVGYS